ncbi:MAG: hypothetical protein HLUCCO03_11620 [Marinobacter sp. HL-58]|nr:MAG: hypothetical protein HLUCCO03_11620 [Marinobacter sp. HL-58]
MNMLAALAGYGGFVIALLTIGLIGYWRADQLEAWCKRKLVNRRLGGE